MTTRRSKADGSPLVAVVDYSYGDLGKERLACGHVLMPAADIAGRTRPTRRRCWKCRDAYPTEAQPRAAAPEGEGPTLYSVLVADRPRMIETKWGLVPVE